MVIPKRHPLSESVLRMVSVARACPAPLDDVDHGRIAVRIRPSTPKRLRLISWVVTRLANNVRPCSSSRKTDDEGENDSDFEPDTSGYRITLADGVESRLRFRKVLGRSAAEEIRLVPEFRTPNRDVPLDATCGVEAVAERVLEYFSVPHMEIKFSATGRLTFQGLSTSFTVWCASARDASETKRAASLDAGP